MQHKATKQVMEEERAAARQKDDEHRQVLASALAAENGVRYTAVLSALQCFVSYRHKVGDIKLSTCNVGDLKT